MGSVYFRRKGCQIATFALCLLTLTIVLTWRPLESIDPYQLNPFNSSWTPNRLLKFRPASSNLIAQLTRTHHSTDGHLYLDDKAYRVLNTTADPVAHPILTLLEEASRAWNTKLLSQSTSLQSAIAEYRRRNGRSPPKGYDQWWNWAKAHNVKLLDEYGSLQRAIQPFFALPPHVFKARAAALVNDKTKWAVVIFVVSIRKGKLSLSGQQASIGARPREMVNLLRDIAPLLPDLDIPISNEDLPAVSVSARNYERHVELARNFQLLNDTELEDIKTAPGLHGWPNTCPANSRLRVEIEGLQNLSLSTYTQSFIHDHLAATNLCDHPDLQSQIGFLSVTRPKVHPFFPLFGFTKLHGFAEFPLTPTAQYNLELGVDPAWEKKKSGLMWRGGTTGIVFNWETNWRQSQRTRLVMFANKARGNVTVRTTSAGGTLKYFEADTKALNEKYFDIGFAGAPVQCDNTDGTCDMIKSTYTFKKVANASEMNEFKYILDVDGNGWSGRFHRLMSTKSAVLKSTVFPEWYADRIQPWYHYIPVRVDYQDLYDIMSFFLGDLTGKNAHDELGRRIGQAGSDWTNDYWRPTDMQAYMYLLLLEYNRLLNRDPNNLASMDLA